MYKNNAPLHKAGGSKNTAGSKIPLLPGGAVILAVIDNYCRQYFRRAKRAEGNLCGYFNVFAKNTLQNRRAKRAEENPGVISIYLQKS